MRETIVGARFVRAHVIRQNVAVAALDVVVDVDPRAFVAVVAILAERVERPRAARVLVLVPIGALVRRAVAVAVVLEVEVVAHARALARLDAAHGPRCGGALLERHVPTNEHLAAPPAAVHVYVAAAGDVRGRLVLVRDRRRERGRRRGRDRRLRRRHDELDVTVGAAEIMVGAVTAAGVVETKAFVVVPTVD